LISFFSHCVSEPVLEPIKQSTARTLVIHPFRNGPAVEATSINTLSIRETFAEKFRAAMTRREPAIRNFYDIDHVVTAGFLSIDDEQLLALAGQKLAVPGNAPVDVSDSKLTELGRQLSGAVAARTSVRRF
jgi:hypothetical protein